jgi:hypothetical protein
MKAIYIKPSVTPLLIMQRVSILEGSRQTRVFDSKGHDPKPDPFNNNDFWDDDKKSKVKSDDLAF